MNTTRRTSTLPLTHCNYAGKEMSIQYPEHGSALLNIGTLTMWQIEQGRFAVLYGLQTTYYDNSREAFREFQSCLSHMAECDGILS
jgi:hypothetical protein